MRAFWLTSFLWPIAGCGGETEAPPADDNVVTYEMTTTIPAGEEVEHCKFVRAPAEGMLVNEDEVSFSAGSHHVLLFDTSYDEIPTETNGGDPIVYLDEEQGVFDCSSGVQFFVFSTLSFIAGSQNSNGDSILAFPPHVAMTVPPNRVMLINAHYINTTSEELHPDISIKLHTIDENAYEVEGDLMFLYDLFIKVPALGGATSTLRCDVSQDITITNAQSHMHARGVDFEAVAIDPAGERATIYETDRWENVPVHPFEDGLQLAAGSRVEQTCGYDNGESREIYMGPSSSDEMCAFFASYYPAAKHVSLCSGSEEAPVDTFFFGAEWEGQGTATCAASLDCFNTTVGQGFSDPFVAVRGITDCMEAADPAVSPELSDAIGCTMSAFFTGGNPFDDCSAELQACLAK